MFEMIPTPPCKKPSIFERNTLYKGKVDPLPARSASHVRWQPFGPLLLAWMSGLPCFSTSNLSAQEAPILQLGTLAPLPPEVQRKLDAYSRNGDWAGYCDFLEKQPKGIQESTLDAWFKALSKAGRNDRLLSLAEEWIPKMDGKDQARLSTARLTRAQALTALKRFPQSMEAHLDNGHLGWKEAYINALAEARNAQDGQALERAADAILAKHPKHPGAIAAKGEALARQMKHGEAEPFLKEALQLGDKGAETWMQLGYCALARKDSLGAEEAFTQALSADPKRGDAYYWRGTLRMSLARYKEAQTDFQAALLQTPEDPNFKSALEQAERYLTPPEPRSTSRKGNQKPGRKP